MTVTISLSQKIWARIATQYENGAYSDAVKNAVLVLTDLIRERTGLDGDGAKLVGSAFGGTEPRIVFGNLRTESGKDMQAGYQDMLRGVYKAIRNPLNHEMYSLSQIDCDSVLVAIDYLYKAIEGATHVYESEKIKYWLVDELFPDEPEYIATIVDAIPPEKYVEAARDIFSWVSEVDPNRLRSVFAKIIVRLEHRIGDERLHSEVRTELLGTCTQAVGGASNTSELHVVVSILPKNIWGSLGIRERIRAEKLMLDSFAEGSYSAPSDCLIKGHFGIQIARLGTEFGLLTRLSSAVHEKLWGDWDSQNYVGRYFLEDLPVMLPEKDWMGLLDGLLHASFVDKATTLRRCLLDSIHGMPADFKTRLLIPARRHASADPSFMKQLESSSDRLF